MTKFELKRIGNYKIELEDYSKEFIVNELDSENNSFDELKKFNQIEDAEKYIDDREKRRAAFIGKKKEPLFIFRKDRYSSKITEAKITSISGKSVWIIDIDDKHRSKEYGLSGYMKNTEDNKKKLSEIDELETKIIQLKDSIEEYSEEEIKKYFEI